MVLDRFEGGGIQVSTYSLVQVPTSPLTTNLRTFSTTLYHMQTVLSNWIFFDSRGQAKWDLFSDAAEKEKGKKARALICVYCNHLITPHTERISVNGAHTHEFTNPHGIVFRIGCFRTADGCIRIGNPTDEWTWFKGYYWSIANCGQCYSHLGWHFANNEDDQFFGLILGNLAEGL